MLQHCVCSGFVWPLVVIWAETKNTWETWPLAVTLISGCLFLVRIGYCSNPVDWSTSRSTAKLSKCSQHLLSAMSCAADVDDIDVIHCEAADGRIMRLDWIELVIRRSSLRWVLYLWRTILCHFVRCVFSERSLDLILCTCNASYWTVWRFSAAIFVAHHMPFIPYSPHMPTYLTYIVKTCKKKHAYRPPTYPQGFMHTYLDP